MFLVLDEKRKLLIDTATKIFAEKGYFSTSVQEIAEQCSMSKASLYKLFSSKEDLFIEVFEYHQNSMFQKASRYSFDTSLSPKELLIKQFSTQIEDFLERKDFIFMQLKDIPSSGNNNLKILMKKMKARIILWQKDCLIQAYGDQIKPYSWDLTFTLHGLMKEYLTILSNEQFDSKLVSLYLVDRLDSIVNDLLENRPKPLFTEEITTRYLTLTDSSTLSKKEEISIQLSYIEQYINTLKNEEQRKNLTSSLTMLKDELRALQPRTFLIDVLLHYFKKEKELVQTIEKLRSLTLN